MANKPTVVANWADTGTITDPGAAKRTLGWVAEDPPFEFFNYLHNAAGQWMAWLDEKFADGPSVNDLKLAPSGDLIFETENDFDFQNPTASTITNIDFSTDGVKVMEIQIDDAADEARFYGGGSATPTFALDGASQLDLFKTTFVNAGATLAIAETGILDISKAADPTLTDGALWTRDGFLKSSDGTNALPVVHRVSSRTTTDSITAVDANVVNGAIEYTIPANFLTVGTTIRVTSTAIVTANSQPASGTTSWIIMADADTSEIDVSHSNGQGAISTLFNLDVVFTVRSIGVNGEIFAAGSAHSSRLTADEDNQVILDSDATMDTTSAITIRAAASAVGGSNATFETRSFVVEIAR